MMASEVHNLYRVQIVQYRVWTGISIKLSCELTGDAPARCDWYCVCFGKRVMHHERVGSLEDLCGLLLGRLLLNDIIMIRWHQVLALSHFTLETRIELTSNDLATIQPRHLMILIPVQLQPDHIIIIIISVFVVVFKILIPNTEYIRLLSAYRPLTLYSFQRRQQYQGNRAHDTCMVMFFEQLAVQFETIQ